MIAVYDQVTILVREFSGIKISFFWHNLNQIFNMSLNVTLHISKIAFLASRYVQTEGHSVGRASKSYSLVIIFHTIFK